MGIFDFITRPFRAELNRAAASGRPTVNSRGRTTTEEAFSMYGAITSPPSPEETWRTLDLDTKTLANMSPARLMRLLPDLSPEISDALYLFLRMCNPGYEVSATWPNSDRPHTAGQKALDQFIATLEGYHGTMSVLIGKLFLGQFLRGAALAELVLKDGRIPVDLATPDPYIVRFRETQDKDRGTIWQMGQFQKGVFVPLDIPTIAYIPVDPFFGPPYGRAMVSPALFTSLFLLGLLHDIRRVVSQQGYNRLDIEVDLAALVASMPKSDRADPDKVKAWTNQAISDIQDVYASLEPDDAYIHSTVVKLNRPVGTADSDSLKAIDALIRGLERMAARGLKTMPLLMGSSESVTETHAKYQWALQATTVRSMQHMVETLLNRLLSLALQAQGIGATVTWKFASLAPDRYGDEQTRSLEIQNARAEYDNGWITQDEAAEKTVGHKAAEEEPRQALAAIAIAPEEDKNAEEDPAAAGEEGRGHRNGYHPVYKVPTAAGA